MADPTNVLSNLDILQIELGAVTACTERSDFDPLRPPAYQMTDNDYRAGIREVFADHEDWEPWMVEPLLRETKRSLANQEAVRSFCDAFVGRFMG